MFLRVYFTERSLLSVPNNGTWRCVCMYAKLAVAIAVAACAVLDSFEWGEGYRNDLV
jgi:hypothetical protein